MDRPPRRDARSGTGRLLEVFHLPPRRYGSLPVRPRRTKVARGRRHAAAGRSGPPPEHAPLRWEELGPRARAAWVRAEPWLYPALAFTLALGLRLWWARHWIVANYGDQPDLELFAANVAHGRYYGTTGAYWPPAFIFLAGFVERAFGTAGDFLAVREVNAVVSALAAAIAADCARRLFRSPVSGLLAGVLLALYAPAIYYANTFLGTPLDTLTLVAVCDAALAYRDRPHAWRLALTGVLLGLATLTKPTLLPLIVPAFVVWGLRGPRGFDLRFAGAAAGIALAIALAATVPWTIRNLRVTGSPVFVDVNGGVNLLIAHNAKSTGRWMNLGYNNPILLRGHGYDQPDTNRYAMDAALAYFVSHPGQDVIQWVHIMGWFWGEPDPDIARYGSSLAPLVRVLHVPLIQFSLLRDLAVLGMVLMAARGRRGGVLAPLVLVGYSAGIALLFWAPRFRAPVSPLLAVAAAGGMLQLATGWARERRAYARQAAGP